MVRVTGHPFWTKSQNRIRLLPLNEPSDFSDRLVNRYGNTLPVAIATPTMDVHAQNLQGSRQFFSSDFAECFRWPFLSILRTRLAFGCGDTSYCLPLPN